MDNYEKMTKDELILKLVSQTHLAEAVEAKDAEIATLTADKKRLEAIERKYINLVDVNEKNKRSAETSLEDIKNLQNAQSVVVDDLKKAHEKELANQAKDFNERLKAQHTQLSRRINELNRFINNFGSLLKMLQGTTDLAIELNSFLVGDVQKE